MENKEILINASENYDGAIAQYLDALKNGVDGDIRNEMRLSIKKAQTNSAVVAVVAKSRVLDPRTVENLDDASTALETASLIDKSGELAICAICEKVRRLEWYKPAYKSYSAWAESRLEWSRSNADSRARVGILVTSDGKHSIFYKGEGKDFSFTQLLALANAFKVSKGKQAIENLTNAINAGEYTPDMSAKQIADKASGKDITSTVEVSESKAEKSESKAGKAESKAGKAESKAESKTEKLPKESIENIPFSRIFTPQTDELQVSGYAFALGVQQIRTLVSLARVGLVQKADLTEMSKSEVQGIQSLIDMVDHELDCIEKGE